MENETKNGGMGAIMGVIIIIALLATGGWYFFSNRVEKIKNQQAIITEVNDIITGSSTEIEDIQTDLDNLDLKALD